MDTKEATQTIINKVDEVLEELALKDKITVLQDTLFMLDHYLDEAFIEANS
ncbi:hypothetical protein H7F33_05615 [Pedobacter sp. PAMC26386]|nr:hypothetical protein H7F33_05615 [Pedobacter sp. PAMC26386]